MSTPVQNLDDIPRLDLKKLWVSFPDLLDGATVLMFVAEAGDTATGVELTVTPTTATGLSALKVHTDNTLYKDPDLTTATKFKLQYERGGSAGPVFGISDVTSEKYVRDDLDAEQLKLGSAQYARLVVCDAREVTTAKTTLTGAPAGLLMTNTDKSEGYKRYKVYLTLLALSDQSIATLTNRTEIPYFRKRCCMGSFEGTTACDSQNLSYSSATCDQVMTNHCNTAGFTGAVCQRWARQRPTVSQKPIQDWCKLPANASKNERACFDSTKIAAFIAKTRNDYPNSDPSASLYVCSDAACHDSGLSLPAQGGLACGDVIMQSCTIDVADGASVGGTVNQECVNDASLANEQTNNTNTTELIADGNSPGNLSPNDTNQADGSTSKVKWVIAGIVVAKRQGFVREYKWATMTTTNVSTFTININTQRLDLSQDKTKFERTTRTSPDIVIPKFVFQGDPVLEPSTTTGKCGFRVRIKGGVDNASSESYVMKVGADKIIAPDMSVGDTQSMLLVLGDVTFDSTLKRATATSIRIPDTTDLLGIDPLTNQMVVIDSTSTTPPDAITSVILTFDSDTAALTCPVTPAAAATTTTVVNPLVVTEITPTHSDVSALDTVYGKFRLQTWLIIGGSVTFGLFLLIISIALAVKKPASHEPVHVLLK
ncbi:hypothetical protein SARC_04055 [Sphaeroforma arctica JP610]|uniref:Uncharacterized protein n=1 Tax=Sphaeroforma arctica JP610 TaxID=667725 RepID=A0A0L0G4F4_9EUKA|nr:hypothetical protein SARC_04055 [Sphaeroforma arctica JP610]KNC83696.1 hypothetical protein SARC_04055 [Sphaeroforma arctica JP610]|eukprot:XP_014157598.1 hypothetical protein SARC_04055 [Sphaeroforma arctica JP610]